MCVGVWVCVSISQVDMLRRSGALLDYRIDSERLIDVMGVTLPRPHAELRTKQTVTSLLACKLGVLTPECAESYGGASLNSTICASKIGMWHMECVHTLGEMWAPKGKNY